MKPPSEAADDDPMELIHAVMHRYRAQQYQVLRAGPYDLTHMEGKVLGYLALHPGATQSDLARDSGRDKAQLARLIKTLRDQGLLLAQADAADRRNLRLLPTEQGLAVLAALQRQSERLAALAMDGLSAAERLQLTQLLQRVQRNIEKK